MLSISRLAAAPLCAAALTGLMALTAGSARASVTFPFYFDSVPLDGLDASSLVGAGIFTIGTDPGNGLFTAAQLGGVSYSFTLNGLTFTEAGDLTNATFGYDTEYLLSGNDSSRRVQFRPLIGLVSKFAVDTTGSRLVAFDYIGLDGVYVTATDSSGLDGIGDYYIGEIPEPGVMAFSVIAACSVLGLVARKRKK